MQIKNVSFQGIKGSKYPRSIDIDNTLTVLAGKNDAGKSTVLESLNLFFNAKTIQKSMITICNQDEPIKPSVTVTFDQLPESIDIDAGAQTSLSSENLLDSNGCLQITKTFGISGSPSTSIRCFHPVLKSDGTSLLSKKLNELKKIITDNSIDCTHINKSILSSMRAGILEHESLFEWKEGFEVEGKSEGMKNIIPQLESHFPQFYLFRAEQVTGEGEKFVQDPAKLVVDKVLEKHKSRLQEISEEITNDLSRSLGEVASQLRSLAPTLATTFSPNEVQPSWEKAFDKVAFFDSEGVPLASRGSGMRRLALLSFFRASIAEDAEISPSVIYAIEEPEVFLHPDLQREIWSSLCDSSTLPGTQVIATTHSTNLLSSTPVRSVRYVTQDSVKSAEDFRATSANTDEAETLFVSEIESTMGIFSDNKVICFLLVEGSNDIDTIMRICQSQKLPGTEGLLEALEGGKVLILPIGGCGARSLWSNGKLDPLRRKVITITDGDDNLGTHYADNDAIWESDSIDIKLDVREPESLISAGNAASVLSNKWNISRSALSDAILSGMTDGDRWTDNDVPAAAASAYFTIAHGDGIDMEIEANVKTFKKKEGAAKRILLDAFLDPDSVTVSRIEESNLGTTLRVISSLLASQ